MNARDAAMPPEHRIRLRASWEKSAADGAGTAARVDLPATWPEADSQRPFRLARRFGRPRFDPAAFAVALEIADAPGLRAVRLNGLDLPLPAGDARIDLGSSLGGRNLLELDVDLAGLAPATPWGAIALVVAPAPESGRGGRESAGP